jgi:hypothetical protein
MSGREMSITSGFIFSPSLFVTAKHGEWHAGFQSIFNERRLYGKIRKTAFSPRMVQFKQMITGLRYAASGPAVRIEVVRLMIKQLAGHRCPPRVRAWTACWVRPWTLIPGELGENEPFVIS